MKDSDDAIYDALSRVLLTGSLPPGTRLIETHVARLFEVSRERVRKALQRLGHERLLEREPRKGAFVRTPSLEQARDIYEARRVCEGGIVARLAHQGLSLPQIEALRRHLAQEETAARERDRAECVRLSGEFHLLLAQATANDAVINHLRELVSRTAMLVALFEAGDASHCGCTEHRLIVNALESRDLSEALHAMYAHLSLIETRLQPRRMRKAVNVDALLCKAWEGRIRSRTSATAD